MHMSFTRAVIGFATAAAVLTACGASSANGVSAGASSPALTGEPMQQNPVAANGQPCTMQADGQPLSEMQGVSARDGECLINLDGAVATTAHGQASPEEAIRSMGFGRFDLVRYRPDQAIDSLVYYYESENGKRVGDYSVNVMADGSFIVHRIVASSPIRAS